MQLNPEDKQEHDVELASRYSVALEAVWGTLLSPVFVSYTYCRFLLL
jgi:hypothetical protein